MALCVTQVWDVMSNKEAVELVASTPDYLAATKLVDVAASRWTQFRPNSKQDDVSAVVMYLHHDVADLHRDVADQWAPVPEGGGEMGCVGIRSESFRAADDAARSERDGISRPDVVFNHEGQKLESRPDSAFEDARCHANNNYRTMLQGTLCDDMHFAVEV